MSFRPTRELKLSPEDVRRIRDAEERMGYRVPPRVEPPPPVHVQAPAPAEDRFVRAISRFFHFALDAALVLFGAYVAVTILAGIASIIGGAPRSSPAPSQAEPPATPVQVPREAVNIDQLPIARPPAIDFPPPIDHLPAAVPEAEPQSQAETQREAEPPWEAGSPPPDWAARPPVPGQPDAGDLVRALNRSAGREGYHAPESYHDGWSRDWRGQRNTVIRKKKKKGFFLFRAFKAFGKGLAEGADAVLDPDPESGQWPLVPSYGYRRPDPPKFNWPLAGAERRKSR